MAHTDSHTGYGAPDPDVLDEWYREGDPPQHVQAVVHRRWRRTFQRLPRYFEGSLQGVRFDLKIQAWLERTAAIVLLFGCVGLAGLCFGTVLAAEVPGIPLLSADVEHSVGRVAPVLVATAMVHAFAQLCRAISACLSSRNRQLREQEARYIAYLAAANVRGERWLDRVIEISLNGAQSSRADEDGLARFDAGAGTPAFGARQA